MTDTYVAQVESAVKATRVHGFRSFSWFNQEEPVLEAALERRLPLNIQRAHFSDVLGTKLYTNFYCLGFATPSQHEPLHPRLLPSKETFGRALAAANCGAGYEDEGWAVRAVSGNDIVAHKNGMTLRVPRQDCLLPGSLASPEPEMSLSVRMPRESRVLSPGFYVALGDERLAGDEGGPLVRLYWNLRSEGAVAFMRAATAALNRAKLPFRLKAVDHPARFTRCDAVIVYTTKAHFSLVREVLERVYPSVAPYLKSGTPVFTKAISFGLGLAEDPPFGTSFGLHRCRILAAGILRAHELKRRGLRDRVDTVMDHFAANHVSLGWPYLNPGSADDYVFHPVGPPARPAAPATALATGGLDRKPIFRTAALEIGRLLTQRALWSGSRCNWMGMDVHGAIRSAEYPASLAYKALGPTLFTGTSGIALFLAELHTAGADPAVRRTAIAAIDQALSVAPALRQTGRFGLYDGVTGIALAAAYIGRLLDEDRLQDCARSLLYGFLPDGLASSDLDLVSGCAGMIAGLLTLHGMWREAPLLDAAVMCGDRLLQKARTQEGQCSWRSTAFPKQRALTGFSHGAAGIGYALLELFRTTGASQYSEVARSAFAYERRWFDAEMANWPDFRGVSANARPANHPFSFPVAWCHGSAGIALSRLRAYQILKDDQCKGEALTALRTTMAWTAKALRSETGNFGLCHGLAGNANILAHGSRVLQAEFGDGIALADEVAVGGITKYGESAQRWPFGALGDKSPSLMLGLSGVGHFFLNLSDPALPSPLILEPEVVLQRLTSSS